MSSTPSHSMLGDEGVWGTRGRAPFPPPFLQRGGAEGQSPSGARSASPLGGQGGIKSAPPRGDGGASFLNKMPSAGPLFKHIHKGKAILRAKLAKIVGVYTNRVSVYANYFFRSY